MLMKLRSPLLFLSQKYPNINRWWRHINSFSSEARNLFSASMVPLYCTTQYQLVVSKVYSVNWGLICLLICHRELRNFSESAIKLTEPISQTYFF